MLGDPICNRPLVTIGSNYKYELLYNMGVSLLYARKPADAFDCLIETVQLHHRDPLIWLRLAECCIQVHKPVIIFSIFSYFYFRRLAIFIFVVSYNPF
jgi:CCR4-NOT transcription complex subunit 10